MILINGKTIHLRGKNISYVMVEDDDGNLLHFYFGKKIAVRNYASMTEEWHEDYGFASEQLSLDVYPQEYPSYGCTDLREPAYEAVNAMGNAVSRLEVKEFIIHDNCAVQTEGMPCLFEGGTNADTLEAVLCDDSVGLEVRLFYTVFGEYDVIARHAVIRNNADSDMRLMSAYSVSLDLPPDDYDMVYFTGAWGRECDMKRVPLEMGAMINAENARGTSGHQLNPFAMLAERGADENKGRVYGFSLIYSGNHSTAAKTDQFGLLRIRQGINPRQFEKTLKKGECFTTPQSVLCYSEEGFGGVSRTYHDVYRNNLMRGKLAKKRRPILINNWEGTYFDFTEEKLLEMALKAKEAGIEMFVLDDGWFGKRDRDNCSLGDWYADLRKLPSGISGFAEKINALGLKFGLWFEPEMVSRDSDLYRAHPDWIIHVPQREPVMSRWQYVLDLSRDEVCDYIINAVSRVLSGANIEYVKWDMNRQITDMPRLGYNHEYVLGYYKIVSAVTEAFPEVLFEGCSSGGGRFDPGVLAYMPQIWASDNSDAASRLKIQWGLSMCYPISSISSHVTVCPNHQTGRTVPLKMRAEVAYGGTFGYELDITKMAEKEIEEITRHIEFRKSIDDIIRNGSLYRLKSPFDTNYCAYEILSKDKREVYLFVCRRTAAVYSKDARIKLRMLDENAEYADADGNIYAGDLLMHRGIRINYSCGDYASAAFVLKRV